MKKLASVVAGLLLFAIPAVAQVHPDGNLLGRPIGGGAGLAEDVSIANLYVGGMSLPTQGFFLQPTYPTTGFTSWLNTNNVGGKNPYGYLGIAGQLVIPTTQGEPAIVGASQTTQTPPPNVCCAMGLAGVAINNNTTNVQGAWPLYATMARLPGTGSVQVEFDVANMDSTPHDVGPYSGPVTGSSGALALQSGGEPPAVGATTYDSSYLLGLFNNGAYTRHGLVFGASLFNPTYCTTACPAIDLAYGHEIRWARDTTDVNGSFIRGNNNVAGAGNGIVLSNFGTLFENTAGGTLAAVAQQASLPSNAGYIVLSTAANADALVAVGTGNGASNANLQLAALGTGAVLAEAALQLKPMNVGSLPACSSSTKYQMYAVNDNNTAVAYGGAITAGGSNITIAFCNGTAWLQH